MGGRDRPATFWISSLRIEEQLHAVRESAAAGDAAYQRMLQVGRDHDLRSALEGLAGI